MRHENKKLFVAFYVYLLMLIWILFSVFPLFWMVTNSFKLPVQSFAIPPVWIFKPILNNYREVLFERRFFLFAQNSLIVASFSTLLVIVISLFPAYSLARFKFFGNKAIAFWILCTSMFPLIAIVIPIYILWSKFGLLDTRIGLIILYTALNLPFATWLLRGFIMGVPPEIEESAMVDGCSRIGGFFRTTVFLIAPGLTATIVLCFIFSWNEFMLALLLTGVRSRTLPVAVTAFMSNRGIVWGQMCAAGTIIAAPLLVLAAIFQRYLVRGLTLGAIK